MRPYVPPGAQKRGNRYTVMVHVLKMMCMCTCDTEVLHFNQLVLFKCLQAIYPKDVH